MFCEEALLLVSSYGTLGSCDQLGLLLRVHVMQIDPTDETLVCICIVAVVM